MDQDGFRRLALSLPHTAESAHMGHPDFRVRGKIFATLRPERGEGVAMLTPEQQEVLCGACPDAFLSVGGSWGLRGCTAVRLGHALEEDVAAALRMAWRNKAPKRLAATLED